MQVCTTGDGFLQNLSKFGDNVCPCGRDDNGQRKLACALGKCQDCQGLCAQLPCCDAEADFQETDPVKLKWLRPIKIGNRNETEWAYETKPYNDFMALFNAYYCNTYRMHNWIYKRQDAERHQNRKRLQAGRVILEFDYAAKASQFMQDCMPCTAARQTSNFVVFAHFAPKHDDAGNNIGDTTEVFTFHSNCLTQDTHSIRRCLTHVLENLRARGLLTALVAYFWADGCGAQNKGRKSFRQWSELAVTLGLTIIANFPASHHFAGPWDTEGGRQARTVTNHIRNERDVSEGASVLDAGDNVRLLRKLMKHAGEPDAPVPTQTMWRPAVDTPTDTTTHTAPCARPPKPKKQARGRTAIELKDDDTDAWYFISRRHILQVEPCECRGDCSCPQDGRLTYKRDEGYDSSHIVGTMSTYCYGFFKKPLHVSVRQFSCYCRWCSRSRYDKCKSLNVVRHNPSKPVRPGQVGYTKWRDEGWRNVILKIKSAPDRAVTRIVEQSLDAAMKYVSALPKHATVCVMTKEDGAPSFWLASKQSEVQIASASDESTGITRGEQVLPIIWYDRLGPYKYIKLDEIAHVSVSSVCVTGSRIVWQRTTTNRFYLGEHTHNTLMELVHNIIEI